MPRFVHLHCHTEFSLIDGLIRIKPLIKAMQAAQIPACAMTDFSNLCGLVQFYKAANNAGIKPIIGADILIDNGSESSSRLVLLCQNNQGYVHLSELISLGYLEGLKKDVPHIHREWFKERAEGLIALSAGRVGDIGQALLANNPNTAKQHLQFWKSHFPNRFYLELQRTGRAQEEQYIHAAIQLAIETQTPVVATNDVCFLQEDDYEAHEVRVCIHDGYVLDDNRRPRLYTPQQYLRTPEEMTDLFSDIPEAIENTWRIAQRCNIELTLDKNYLPDFPVPEGMTMDQYFCDLSRQGLDYRFKTVLKNKLAQRQEYDERLQIELDVILQMGFPGYFLIVADFIQWSKDNGVPVGPGRGSGAGSIVAYALKITDLDPIEYDLLFERFLNPERVSMPDFDIDFCMEGRDRVIQYVTELYGKKRVSQIITFGTMAAKAVVRDVGRVLGHPYPFVDQISKLIPFEIGITLSKALEQEEQLNQRYQNEEEVTTLIDMALKLEGLNRNVGTHAGGVVIGPSPLTDFCPLYWDGNPENTMVTQLDKNDVESIGLVKFDFLGLRTLTIIKWALENIIKIGSEAPDMLEIPLDDKATFDLLKQAQTTAVFQLESRGMKELIKRLLPDCFEDIIALVALFRPGPLQSGMVDDFINRKHGRAEIEYPHPDLEPVLKPTYGIILYQEQVMQISQVLANYTLGGADLLRRCLAGSTQIIDAATGQYVTLQQVADNPKYWLGREVFSLDLETQKITTKPISAIYPNGTREVWEITTKTNKKIQATADHLFYTLMGWQPLADFKVGERIALSGRLAPAQNVNAISDAQIKLIAYLLGDGHLSTKNPSSSYFCNSDNTLIDDFQDCTKALFGKLAPTDEQLHEGRKTVIYARIGFISVFNQWVDQHVKRAHSRDKVIPDWVFSLSEKQLQLFLGTLWSTDGSFDTSIGHTDYTSTSEQLIIQIQQLLLRLGIIGLFNIKRIQYKNQPHISYRVQITGREEMEKFQYIIAPFLSAAKRQKALLCQQKNQAKTYNQSKHSLPPQAISLIGAEKKRTGLTWSQIDQAAERKPGTMCSGLSFKGKPTRCLSRQRVRYFAQALQSQKLQAIADSEIFWDEITDIQVIGQEAVFDLSIPDTHNFVANDFIAHNCMGKKKPEEMAQQRDIFMKGSTGRDVDAGIATYVFDLMEKFAGYGFNKSHSAAYAFVSYQTAWLKAHYPAAFMAAVLSSDMDNTDKVVGLIDNCREMKLTVKPPHVNYCDYKFTIADNNTILYGLGAIKGVGENAIENIVASRKENNSFSDLFDFCKKIDLRKVNRRVLEALVKTGCFDNMGASRAVLMKSLDTAIKLAEKHASDKNTGQNSLFGMFDAPQEQAEEKIPYAENVTEWTDIQRLNGEKDCLGLYLTGHPIDQYRNELKNFSYTPLSKIRPTNRGSTVKVIGLLLGVRVVNSRRGKMAIVQLDDNTGRLDAAMYSTLYTEVQHKLEKDSILVLEGEIKEDEYNGGFSMSANSVMTFIEAREKSAKYIVIQLLEQQVNKNFTQTLFNILRTNQGNCPIIIDYQNKNAKIRLRLGAQWKVMPTDDLIIQLETLLGRDKVWIEY